MKIMKNYEKSGKLRKIRKYQEKPRKIKGNKKSVKIRKNQDKSRKLRKIFCM